MCLLWRGNHYKAVSVYSKSRLTSISNSGSTASNADATDRDTEK